MADLDQSHVGECGRGIPLSRASTHFMTSTNHTCIMYTDLYEKVGCTRSLEISSPCFVFDVYNNIISSQIRYCFRNLLNLVNLFHHLSLSFLTGQGRGTGIPKSL